MLDDWVTHLHTYRNLAHGRTQIALIWATLKAKPTDRAQTQNGGSACVLSGHLRHLAWCRLSMYSTIWPGTRMYRN